MSTETQSQTSVNTQPLVKITEMDHIVLRNKDVEVSLRFYTEVLGLKAERVKEWRAGDVRFPSARINADTIIDFFGSDQEPSGKEGTKNQDHFCMVIEPTDMEELKTSGRGQGEFLLLFHLRRPATAGGQHPDLFGGPGSDLRGHARGAGGLGLSESPRGTRPRAGRARTGRTCGTGRARAARAPGSSPGPGRPTGSWRPTGP